MLGREGYEVTTAEDVGSALDQIRTGPLPDLLISDLRMPDGSATTNYFDLYKAGHFFNETKQEGVSAPETPCSVGLRPSKALEEALSPVLNGIDAHRATLQDSC